MKKFLSLVIALITIVFVTNALAASFTAGNLVVYRESSGASGPSGTLTNVGNAVFLDEYTTNGTLVQSIMMPTNWFGASAPLVANGTATSEGLMTLSIDGRFVVLTGYGGTLGLSNATTVSSLTAITAPRVIALVDGTGRADTSTLVTNATANGETIRAAASTDGTNIWISGDSGGARYTTRGTVGTPTQLSIDVTNLRGMNIFSNQLYATSASGLFRALTVGSGLPTTSGQGCTNLPGFFTTGGSPYGFVLVNLKGGADPVDTLYYADDFGAAVFKWSLVSGNWTSNGFVTLANVRGITAKVGKSGSSTNCHLYVTSAATAGTGILAGYVDYAGWNQPPTGDGGALADNYDGQLAVNTPNPGSQTAFRGVAFVPQGTGDPFPSGAGQISVGPLAGFTTSGLAGCPVSATKDYSIANPGTSSVGWSASVDTNYVTLSATSGTLTAGQSTTVTISFNGNVSALLAGTNTATVTFTNVTSAIGTTTRTVTFIGFDQQVSPSDAFSSSGQPGGPFSPVTKTYTLSGGNSAVNWTASHIASNTWVTLSATTGGLSGCSSTNITVTINTNVANGLAIGNYSDVITFSNVTAGTVVATRAVSLVVGSLFFFDDFSTFSSGNIVGQQGWTQHGTASGAPIQIAGGQLAMPAGQTTDNQDIYKNCVATTNQPGISVFSGMTMTISNVPVGNISYIMAMCSSNNGTVGVSGSFANYRLACTNNGSGIAFATRTTGQAQDQFQNGSFTISTATVLRVVLMSDPNGTNTTLYVNPTSPILASNTPYMVHVMGAGASAATGVGSIMISQFATATVANPGVYLGKFAMSTNYADVYNFITTAAPPADAFATWQAQYFSGGSNNANAAASADPDGDGMSNTNEFLAGFNPTNGAAYLHVISIVNVGNDSKVTYLGANGDTPVALGPKTNVLEVSTGTGNGSYTNNFASTGQTNILSGGTGVGVVTNMVDSGGATNVPSRYYRVRVLP